MKLSSLLLCAAVGCALLTLSVKGGLAPAAAESPAVAKYHCPMHPSYVQDRKGDCPVCGMKLVPVKGAEANAGAAAPTGAAAGSAPAARPGQYTCPMHPEVVRDGEGRCPTCGMKLTRVEGAAPPAAKVAVAPAKQRVLGIAVAPAERAAASHQLRALGRVAADEARVYKVNAGLPGAFKDVAPVTTGDRVKKDQYLGSFYAPDIIMTAQLFILNSQGWDRRSVQADANQAAHGERDDGVKTNQTPNTLQNVNLSQRMMQFQNMGVSPRQMDEIARTQRIPETVQVYAPADGQVLARGASPGLKFDRGFEFFRIADLRKVWVIADVFPQDARRVRPGMAAAVSLPEAHLTLPAKIAEILPQFDAATRTLKVKLTVDNPDLVLRPDMFVDVSVKVELPAAVVIPSDAVVDSGLAKRVFVETADGTFEPRAVATGWRSGEQVEIVKGLREGERVVVAGTFFLDSETRMKPPPVSGAAAAGTTSVPSGPGPRGGAGDVREAQASAAEEAMHRHGEDAR